MRVMVVDDSSVIRERLVVMLSNIPSADVVGVAATAEDALGSVVRLRPDVVVLDIRMPGMSGLDALPRFRELVPAATVIVLTNYPQDQYRSECLAAGASFFLDKSKEFRRFRDLLVELAEGRPAIQISAADGGITRLPSAG